MIYYVTGIKGQSIKVTANTPMKAAQKAMNKAAQIDTSYLLTVFDCAEEPVIKYQAKQFICGLGFTTWIEEVVDDG